MGNCATTGLRIRRLYSVGESPTMRVRCPARLRTTIASHTILTDGSHLDGAANHERGASFSRTPANKNPPPRADLRGPWMTRVKDPA